MKKILSISSLFLFAVASVNFAAAKESGSVSFPNEVRVGNTTLPAGSYSVHWEAGGNQVKLSGNGKEVSVPVAEGPGNNRGEVLMHHAGNADVVDGFTVKSTSFTIKNQ